MSSSARTQSSACRHSQRCAEGVEALGPTVCKFEKSRWIALVLKILVVYTLSALAEPCNVRTVSDRTEKPRTLKKQGAHNFYLTQEDPLIVVTSSLLARNCFEFFILYARFQNNNASQNRSEQRYSIAQSTCYISPLFKVSDGSEVRRGVVGKVRRAPYAIMTPTTKGHSLQIL